MSSDFFVAFLTGWLVLIIFWTTIIIFVYLRNPPNSRLTKKITLRSYIVFFMIFLIIIFFK